MVSAVRRGLSLREVARRWRVSLNTVQRWVRRAGTQRLERVDWRDQPPGIRVSTRRTAPSTEAEVLALRQTLRHESVLGEHGAAAIQRELLHRETVRPVPSVRTIGRILVRHGAVDRHQRVRRPAPSPGWHLPVVRRGAAELDSFDVIEDLKLEAGPWVDVVTGVSLHGGLPAAWPVETASTAAVLRCLETHWQAHGCPQYAQFDNDTRFQGPHQYPDTFGRVVRFCLQLGVTPVFAPPYEFGLQNAIEHFNGLFTAKVWRRFHYASLGDFAAQSARYVSARRLRLMHRIAQAPPRRPWPTHWAFAPRALPAALVIFIRRTSATGHLSLLGHDWLVDRTWCQRLVRAEVDLQAHEIRCTALRRRDPENQPLLTVLAYRYPRADLVGDL